MVVGGAKYAASLGTDEHVTTRICGERNAITALRTISLDPKVWTGPRNTSFTALLLRNVPSWFCLPLQGECIAEYSQNGASQEDKQTDLQTWIKKCRRMIGLFFHLRLPRLAGQQCF
ncbi:MAG: hypothetical protein AUH08_08030 [Verrucomicrobia bacterium 13_2_20CM_54_12]|nr:MAG: hypothetical protein AUH08_08030 [Verrucomicrobia bacterium 13_2_20CM_54_12]